MSTAITKSTPDAAMMESVVIGGDLSQLSPAQRVSYYMQTCQSLGLNPLTKPFDYLKLNGQLRLYARKDATDQLRNIQKISLGKPETELISGIFTVNITASTPDGRTDADMGAVNVEGIKGDALANAMMKAITKAKRRVTLSICGLGMMDETEIETVPDARPVVVTADGEIIEHPKAQPPRPVPAPADSEPSPEAWEKWYGLVEKAAAANYDAVALEEFQAQAQGANTGKLRELYSNLKSAIE